MSRLIALSWRLAVVLFAALAVLAACGGSGGEPELIAEESVPPTETPAATPEPEPTPAPTEAPAATPTPGPISPLNGMPVDAPSSSRLLAVKIDNHDNARPQSGIQHADLMVEIWVEGITRFLSVWLHSDTDVVGPIRSMRPTDFAVQNSWASSFVNSGGQGWVQAIGNASNVAYFMEPPGTFRASHRFAPHNVYGDTTALRTLDGRGDYDAPIGPLWTFGEMPADAAAATTIATNWPAGYVVNWAWNGTAYERSTYDTPHNYVDEEGNQHQITAETLVMLEMDIYQASGGSGSPVPASDTTGSGTAWVFAEGKMQRGSWSRESENEWFVLAADGGGELIVPPGHTWMVLAETGGVVPS